MLKNCLKKINFIFGPNIFLNKFSTRGIAEIHSEKELKTTFSHTVFSKISGENPRPPFAWGYSVRPDPPVVPPPPNQIPGSAPCPMTNKSTAINT